MLGGLNLQQYAPNPTEWVDPFGLSKFASQDEAADDALKKINPTSIRESREYGGMIYKNRDGTYSYTKPIKGDIDSVDPGGPNSCPRKSKPVAYYHTHGATDRRYDNEHFSPGDLDYAEHYKIDGYVGTPKGRVGKFDRKTKNVSYRPNVLPTS